MTQIRVLEQDTIDKIAAGEVIERPDILRKRDTLYGVEKRIFKGSGKNQSVLRS